MLASQALLKIKVDGDLLQQNGKESKDCKWLVGDHEACRWPHHAEETLLVAN